MGLLSQGTPLPWSEVSKLTDHVREHGIAQLLATIEKYKSRENDDLLWGDEIEYMVVQLSKDKATLGLRQEDILDNLMSIPDTENVSFHQEYGRYMIESTPRHPFDYRWKSLVDLENNMKLRRDIAVDYLDENERLLSMSSYPLLGVGRFAETDEKPRGEVTQSLFLPDNIINLHPRFPTLSKNIRERRGKKVEISLPVFQDKNTPQPWVDPITTERPEGVPADKIYMDAMGFGMGCCCVQLTFQGSSMDESRNIYDSLTPLTPILLALSAASPIFRGTIADQDVRWNVVSGAVDDRTDEDKKTIAKSRYDSVDCFISRTNPILQKNADFYNDINIKTNPVITEQLEKGGLDKLLTQHYSHLFIRDPLVIFEELINQDDQESTDHFENIQSTNWQTMRFKPPPNPKIGWRIEFRPMEVQFTDYENAAYCVFVVLMSRALLSQDLCFYQPISQIEKNMKEAHKRDPIHNSKFYVRTNVSNQTPDTKPEFAQLTLAEIMNGCSEFVGLIPILKGYLTAMDVPTNIMCVVERYLTLLSKRSTGELLTNAAWIRKFVNEHPDYKHDSQISEKINFDLINAVDKIANGAPEPTLLNR